MADEAQVSPPEGERERREAAAKRLNQSIAGYKIIQVVSCGGMAVVYEAQHANFSKHVALKVPYDAYMADKSFLNEFYREGEILKNMNHPNIVEVFDFGQDKGTHFISMELVRGRTLQMHMRQAGIMQVTAALDISRHIARALAWIHSKHIVHRDVKPANVLINTENQVKLMDFGIAEVTAPGARADLAKSEWIGSPGYASPEQCRRDPLDHRSDIYSLGVVIYEMLTGRLPFELEDPKLLEKIEKEPPPPMRPFNRSVPPQVENIVMKMLSKEPGKRHFAAGLLASELDREYMKQKG